MEPETRRSASAAAEDLKIGTSILGFNV